MMAFTNLCIILFLLGQVDCHSTFSKQVERNISCYLPKPAKIYSWHIHVLYNDQQSQMQNQALLLLEKFKSTFREELGPACTGFFHQDRLCVYAPESAGGPFPVAQWAIFVPMDHYASKVPWFMQNRVSNGTSLDVLVHPNSGCEIEDHTWWAMWGGEKWRLNTETLPHDSPFPWHVEE